VLPRHTKPIEIQVCTTAPTVDGVAGQGEYPGKSFAVAESPGRTRAPGVPCQARGTHKDGSLFIAVTIPITKPVGVDSPPKWTKSDGAEVCFSYPDKNAHHPTFVLHGFPDGTCESSTEAGASRQAADDLHKAVRYAATVSTNAWTAEWAIPLKAADLDAPLGLELNFNLGVFRREAKQWIQWAGTKGQTWRVARAGRIRLVE